MSGLLIAQHLFVAWFGEFRGLGHLFASATILRRTASLLDLLLAVRAEVGASASDDDALDGGFAGSAGLAGARVDVVVELEESCGAFGVYVVGDGGAA
jgi:hypothetical protein